jgi:transposase
MTETIKAYAGVDWASATHQVCVLDADGRLLGERAFPHDGPGLAAMALWISATAGVEADEIAVSIEVPHGPIVETLMEHGFLVHAINPKQLDRFRDRFSMSGAKDDRRDALVLADGLRTDRHCFRRLEPLDAEVIELREWSRIAEELQVERQRLVNRLRDQLWRYYPQMIDITPDLGTEWLLDLWALAPTPAKAKRLRGTTVAKRLKKAHVKRVTAPQILAILRRPPVAVAPGATEAAVAHIRTLSERLRLLNRQLKEAHRKLDVLSDALAPEKAGPGQAGEQHDVTILRSLPGVGRIVLATLLAEASEPLRRRDYQGLRTLSGIAPVTKRSGKQIVVVMRQACHIRLRTAVYHWARVAVMQDLHTRTRYAALRKRGQPHGQALRSIANRLLAMACAMLSSRTLFDPNRMSQRQATE